MDDWDFGNDADEFEYEDEYKDDEDHDGNDEDFDDGDNEFENGFEMPGEDVVYDSGFKDRDRIAFGRQGGFIQGKMGKSVARNKSPREKAVDQAGKILKEDYEFDNSHIERIIDNIEAVPNMELMFMPVLIVAVLWKLNEKKQLTKPIFLDYVKKYKMEAYDADLYRYMRYIGIK